MKRIYTLGAVVFATCGAMFFSGCSTEKIVADYVMPARRISDIKSINVLSVQANVDVKGSIAGNNASGEVAGLVKQLTSARLYKEGYITTVDGIYGDVSGAKAVQDFAQNKKSRHGHSAITTEQGMEKAVLKLDLSLAVDTAKVTKERDFVLLTVPYAKKPAKPNQAPTSTPGEPIVEKAKKPYHVYETKATGLLKANLVDRDGKELYSAEYKVAMPKGTDLTSAAPTLLAAVSRAVGPAIDEVIADISPYKESRAFEANRDGDEKVVLLLEAKAFSAAIEAVDALKEKTFADWEN